MPLVLIILITVLGVVLVLIKNPNSKVKDPGFMSFLKSLFFAAFVLIVVTLAVMVIARFRFFALVFICVIALAVYLKKTGHIPDTRAMIISILGMILVSILIFVYLVMDGNMSAISHSSSDRLVPSKLDENGNVIPGHFETGGTKN